MFFHVENVEDTKEYRELLAETDKLKSAILRKADDHARAMEMLEHKHAIEMDRLKAEHEIALQRAEFDKANFKDHELNEARSATAAAEKTVAVLTKEKEMLDKMVDLNADVVDVKNLVSQLINKLPQIDIKGLTVNNHSKE